MSQAQPRSGGAVVLRRILAFRKSILMFPAAIGAGMAYAGYLATPPNYRAEAVVVLDARKIQVLPTESVVSPLPQESPALRSELDIIASRTMAGRVLRQLSPATVDLLQTDRPGLSFRRLATGYLFPTPSSAASVDAPSSSSQGDTQALQRTLLSNLRVNNDGRSYTIFISYSAGDAGLAADVANAFADSYLNYQIDVKGSGTRQVSDWLGQKLTSLRVSLESSEKALSEFRGSANLLEEDSPSSQQRRVAEAEAAHEGAKAVWASSQARLDIATRQLRETGELAIAESGGDELVQSLRAEQYRIERRIREITDGGATLSGELPGLRSQLSMVRQQMNATVEHAIDVLTADVEVAKSKVEDARKALVAARLALEAASKARVHEAQLEREAFANRAIYESYLARYKQTIEQEGIASPDARIITRAEASQTRTGPKLRNWLMAGLSFGALFGLGIAFAREMTDRSIRSASLLAEQTGQPVLGSVPNLPRRAAKAVPQSNARLTETLAPLSAAVRRSQLAADARVMAITSAHAGEGKTTVAVNLARTMSAIGTKVLLVECNFARPAVATYFSSSRPAERATRTRGSRSFEPLICVDEATGVSFTKAGVETTPSGLVLANKELGELLRTWRERFDAVILDGAALSDSLDAWRVAALADGAIVVVCKVKSNVGDAKAATEQLRNYGCNVLGLIIDRHVEREASLVSASVVQSEAARHRGNGSVEVGMS